jgi:mono/diheme cytochrome c family protein
MKSTAFFFAAATGALVLPTYAADPTRGELLYETHCIGCHSTQVHWRDQRLAVDWITLNTQVRRWQNTIRLDWSDEDVTAVAAYLNNMYYGFPKREPSKTLSRGRAE